MNNPSLSDVAAALRAIDFPSQFEAAESRLLIRLLQLVGSGHPVTLTQVEQAAASLGMPSGVAASMVDKMCELDEAGSIVGIMGLSQRNHPHKFNFNGRNLTTWCAWDALFLPPLLGETAEVESICPATRETIRVRVAPERIEKIGPPESVITVALPKSDGARLESSEAIRKTFCCLVHFFVSAESAWEWASSKSHDFAVLSIEDGYQLGRTVFERVAEYAEASRLV